MRPVLDGFTVGITADRRADEQAALFTRRGARAVTAATIRTLPLADDTTLLALTEALIATPPDVLIANTGIGMRSWFGAAESWGLGEALFQALDRARIYARGPKAAGAVHAFGLDVAARCSTERLRDCISLVLADLQPGERVGLQRDGGPPPEDAALLVAAGAEVVEVPVYRWQTTEDPSAAVRLAEGVIAGRIHAVTFTAGPALRSWLDLTADAGLDADLRAVLNDGQVVIGCVGPVCAEVAVAVGIGDGNVVVPRTARLGPLVRAVGERLLDRSIAVGDLTITGSVVHVADERIELSDTEARLLTSLAARPGVVVGKAELLEQVWGDPDGDEHVVEVAVGRLRRRLGARGRIVAAVPRRGYVLRP